MDTESHSPVSNVGLAGCRGITRFTAPEDPTSCEMQRADNPQELEIPIKTTSESSLTKGVSEFFQDTVTTMLKKQSLSFLPKLSRGRSRSKQDNYNSSILAEIASSDSFQYLTLSIIVLNAIWIGVDTEWNHRNEKDLDSDGTDDVDSYPLEPGAVVIENLFCTYFFVEVVIRFFSFRRKCLFWMDAWFVFDSILVFFMVLETWIMKIIEAFGDGESGNSFASFSALRLMRLLRLTRLRRLMQQFPELMVLVKGIISSTKTVAWTLIFLLLIMYVFAILMTSIIAKPPPHDPPLTPEDAEYLFGSLGDSLMTLFTQGVLGDNLADIVDTILSEGTLILWIFWLFFGIASVTLLNMLIAVLCMVIGNRANEEREMTCEMELRMQIEAAFLLIDLNLDGAITAREFETIKDMPPLREALAACGIDTAYMDDQLQRLQNAIFVNGTEELSLEDFTTKVLDLQPQRQASCLAMELLRSNEITQCKRLNSYMDSVEDGLRRFGEIQGCGPSQPLSRIPANHLLKVLKDRTRQAQHSQDVSSLSAFPVSTEESCLSDLSFIQKASSNLPRTRFAMDAIEGDDHPHSPIVSPRLLARQHPLFGDLLLRPPPGPGGWQAARDVARNLAKRPLELLDLSKSVTTLSAPELEGLFDALPEMFARNPDNTIALRPLEEHLQGCPKYGSHEGWMSHSPCNCVWRLCDALLNSPRSECNSVLEERWPQPPELLQ